MLADGSNGSVELQDNSIVIRRKGFANKLTQGWQGDKSIPLRSVTAVQFRPAGSMMGGYIQFTLLGGRELPGGMRQVTMDENAVIFTSAQQPTFEVLRDVVQEAIAGDPHGSRAPAASAAEELSALADLVEKGFVTREEFEEQKQSLFRKPDAVSPARARARALSSATAESAAVSPISPKKSRAKYVIVALVGLVILATYTEALLPDPTAAIEGSR